MSWLLNQGADEGIVEGYRTSSANADGYEQTLISLSIRAILKRTGKEMKFIVDGVANSAAADTTLIRLLVRGQKIAKRIIRVELSAARGHRERGKDHGFLCDAPCAAGFSRPGYCRRDPCKEATTYKPRERGENSTCRKEHSYVI